MQTFRPLSYYPLSLWSWQDTIKAVCQDKVVIVEEYDEQIASPSVSMTLPSVIALKDYVVKDLQTRLHAFQSFLKGQIYLPVLPNPLSRQRPHL